MNGETHNPTISVLLPVYNSSAYLTSAVESILKQTFTDFELLLINDGSTDNSLSLMQSFKDARIRLIDNEKNIGLTATLNKGIELARGKYIARMDADDISLPARFEKQVAYLDKHADVAVLATRASFMNTEGEITGEWNDDAVHVSENDIKRFTAFSNCLVHPSVMMRARVLKKYRYRDHLRSAEDWDLWLRLLADGQKIHKLDEILVHYRVHPQSAMASEKKQLSLQQRLISSKKKFLAKQFPKINAYFFLVFYSLLRSIGSHWKFNVLPGFFRGIKRLLTTSPIKAQLQYKQLKKALAEHKTNIAFFFPYTHVGGAEQVHADIVKVFRGEKPLVFFTAFSQNDKFLEKFKENGIILNIPQALNYPFLHKKIQRLIASYLNTQEKPVIFGANAGYFYELVHLLSPKAKIIDLIHAFKYQPEGNAVHKKYLAVSQRFANRIFISNAALEEFRKFCFHNNCTAAYQEKLKLIPNYTAIPAFEKKPERDQLHVLFVGRNSPEKRAYLVEKIAQAMDQKYAGKFRFEIVGFSGSSPEIKYHGEVSSAAGMNKIYQGADILLLTSYREGFPMVIMEAMANGVVPVCTPVGDIPGHVKPGTGFVTSSADENVIVKEMCEKLAWLHQNREELDKLSENAYHYAKEHFTEAKFTTAYKSLFG